MIALPSLKCVIAWSDRRNLCSIVSDALRVIVPESEIRALGDDAFVVHSPLPASELRDRLRPHMEAGEGLLVLEFEVWSGYGRAVDRTWLLARGH